MHRDDDTTTRPTIALVMIVRDEARVIARCLESVRELLDCWIICDTGSTDDTQQIIRSSLVDLPGELHEREWVDFGHNRTEVLRLARNKADYLLLLDADMTVYVKGALPALSADSYMLRFSEDPEYWLECLLRGDRHWRSEGSTHEYIATDGPHQVENLRELVIHHHHDGSSRALKLTRDRELLEANLRDSPGNSRAVFYLAQTYRDLGEIDRAVELYARRATMGGWTEETFYSLYQVGALQARFGEWAPAMAALIAAWEYRPTRIEPLYELVCGLRRRGEYQAAHLFVKRALECSRPADHLFVERWIYDWGLLFECSITAYWTGDQDAALRACDRTLDCRDLPFPYREQTVRNRDYCLRAVASAMPQPSFAMKDGRIVTLDLPSLAAARP